MYSGWTYSYRIAVTRSDGDTLRVIERTLPAEPITDGDHLATIRQDELELDHVDVWRLERVGRE